MGPLSLRRYIFRSSRIIAELLLLVVVLTACPGTPVDPLAADRLRLKKMEAQPLEQNWPAHALLWFSEQNLSAVLQQAFTQHLDSLHETLSVHAPLGLELAMTPQMQIDALTVTEADQSCSDCVAVQVSMHGNLGFVVHNEQRQKQLNIEFTAHLKGLTEIFIESDREQKNSVIMARLRAPEQWQVDFNFKDLPLAWNLGISQLVERNLRDYVLEHPLPATELLRLDRQGPVRLRGIRLRGYAGGLFSVEMNFAALDAEAFVEQASLQEGVAFSISQQNLLALARTAALRSPVQDGYAVEPFRLELHQDKWQLWLRLWKQSSRPSARTFLVEGAFVLDAQKQLVVQAQSARELGASGQKLDPLSLISRAAILHQLQQSLRAALPGQMEQRVVGQRLRLVLQRVAINRKNLYVYADLKVLESEKISAKNTEN